MNSNINLNLYKYFYEVAKYNSFTKAAEFLMISQPSLSYSIKVLENQLGKRLFSRKNNKIFLTIDGENIYSKLKNVFEILETMDINNDNISGKIVLGVRSAYASKILPFYMSELNKIYPELEIEFVIGTSEYLFNLLLNKEIDILIDEYYHSEDKFLSIEIKKDDSVFFTIKDKYDKYKSKIINLEYCLKNQICVVKTNKVTKDIKEKYPEFNFLEVQSTPIMINKIKNNSQLIGISPRGVIKDDLSNGKLMELNTDLELPKIQIFLTSIKRLENEKIKVVKEFFKEHNFYDLSNNK